MEGKAELFEVVFALRSASGFASLLNGGQQERHKDGDDGDHHEEFDEGKTWTSSCFQGVHD
jgi:hypothetical protein